MSGFHLEMVLLQVQPVHREDRPGLRQPSLHTQWMSALLLQLESRAQMSEAVTEVPPSFVDFAMLHIHVRF